MLFMRETLVQVWLESRGLFNRKCQQSLSQPVPPVESGDTSPNANCTPILVADGHMPVETVSREFARRSSKLDPKIRELVTARLDEYGLQQHA